MFKPWTPLEWISALTKEAPEGPVTPSPCEDTVLVCHLKEGSHLTVLAP